MMANNTHNVGNSPFEWLTNFTSLKHLLLPSKIVLHPSSILPCSYDEPSKHLDDTSNNSTHVKLNALHVGCGTSTVGESLLLLRERVLGADVEYTMLYGHVVNVDIDNAALDSMEHRWRERIIAEVGEMDWRFIDFAKEETCREALDPYYHSSNGGYFDLVIDKSTFDCLLCAESEAVAGLLCQVYRALRVPFANCEMVRDSLSWGGVYVMITFHPVEFVREMLTHLPGAEWSVDHEVVRREVEDVGASSKDIIATVDEIITRYDKETNCITSTGVRKVDDAISKTNQQSPSASAWSSGCFEPDENYRRTISVFTCRRLPSNSTIPNFILDRDAVRQHVEKSCNEWYKATNPMVTIEREKEISLAFAKAAAGSDTLELKQCYDVIFTDLEKEHLTFEYFLEDWQAYCEKHVDVLQQDCMTLKVALDFLREMQ
jgi:SAM-dependent methyltransferase